LLVYPTYLVVVFVF